MEKKNNRRICIDIEYTQGTTCALERIWEYIERINNKYFSKYSRIGRDDYNAEKHNIGDAVRWIRWSGYWDGLQWLGARISCVNKEIAEEIENYFLNK